MLKSKVMQKRDFQPFGTVSALTLGGGGLGQVWGETTREEAVKTVNLAIGKGITHLDVAPMYGKGEAEKVEIDTELLKLSRNVSIIKSGNKINSENLTIKLSNDKS